MFCNLIKKLLLVYTLLVLIQTEGKDLKHRLKRGKWGEKSHGTYTELDGLRLKKLDKPKSNQTELGNRRQYLTPINDGISQAQGLKPDENSPDKIEAQEYHVSNFDTLKQLGDDNFAKQNLPLVPPKFMSKAFPGAIEKPLLIPFSKPDIRLVPRLFPLRYTKKPDVHVSHVHIQQGGKLSDANKSKCIK